MLHQKVDINKLCRKERRIKRPVANQTPCKVEVINKAEHLNTKYAEAYPALIIIIIIFIFHIYPY
jgi:hypothetical protein